MTSPYRARSSGETEAKTETAPYRRLALVLFFFATLLLPWSHHAGCNSAPIDEDGLELLGHENGMAAGLLCALLVLAIPVGLGFLAQHARSLVLHAVVDGLAGVVSLLLAACAWMLSTFTIFDTRRPLVGAYLGIGLLLVATLDAFNECFRWSRLAVLDRRRRRGPSVDALQAIAVDSRGTEPHS